MEKAKNTGRKWCFGVYVFVQLVLIFISAIYLAPFGQTSLMRYPHVYEECKELIILSIWNFYVLGILVCPMLIVLAIFEILLNKKIDTKLTIGLHVVAIVNGLSTYIFICFKQVHYAIPLTIGIVTDILLIVGSVIWFEKLDRHRRQKSVEALGTADENAGIVACSSREQVVRKVLFGLAFFYITFVFFTLTLHLGRPDTLRNMHVDYTARQLNMRHLAEINLNVHGYIYLPILLATLVFDLLLNKKICPPLTAVLAVLGVAKATISVLGIETISLGITQPLSIVIDVLFAIGCVVWFVMLGLHYKKQHKKV